MAINCIDLQAGKARQNKPEKKCNLGAVSWRGRKVPQRSKSMKIKKNIATFSVETRMSLGSLVLSNTMFFLLMLPVFPIHRLCIS